MYEERNQANNLCKPNETLPMRHRDQNVAVLKDLLDFRDAHVWTAKN